MIYSLRRIHRLRFDVALRMARLVSRKNVSWSRQQSIHFLSRLTSRPSIDVLCHQKDYLNWRQSIFWLVSLFHVWREKPLAYLLREKDFWNYRFLVNQSVLIPRPESEELVRLSLLRLNKIARIASPIPERPIASDADVLPPVPVLPKIWPPPTSPLPVGAGVLDMGCGCGCIGLSIKKDKPNIPVYLVDASVDALQVAQKNARALQVESQGLHFVHSDLFSAFQRQAGNQHQPLKFSLILANLPYVTPGDLHKCATSVRKFEPKMAWMCPNPKEFYTRFFAAACQYMEQTGCIIMELSPTVVAQASQWAEPYFSHITIQKDLAKLPRYLHLEQPHITA